MKTMKNIQECSEGGYLEGLNDRDEIGGRSAVVNLLKERPTEYEEKEANELSEVSQVLRLTRDVMCP